MVRRKRMLNVLVGVAMVVILLICGGHARSARAQIVVTTPTPTASSSGPGTPSPAFPPSTATLTELPSYVVKPHDTLLTIALEMGRNLDEMNCVVRPDFTWDQPLVIGDALESPPAGTLCHLVQPGESLQSIAAAYGVTVDSITAIGWNRLGDPVPGHHLRIYPTAQDRPDQTTAASFYLTFDELLKQPVGAVGGRLQPASISLSVPIPQNWPYGSGHFAWPLYGWITQNFRQDHRGIDLGAPTGTVITAADRGVVLRAGWNGQGYGRFVVIDHRIDYITLYAHLDQIYVEEGEVVAQGQPIGTVGSSGNSTGPHLHFEIRDFGHLVNPLTLLDR